ncbi:MAG: hypothetical protein KBT10_01505 [Bacteroidales bacterium]|nr:hypothetical protein [Candidatus Sodaliphilus aphodohippi]
MPVGIALTACRWCRLFATPSICEPAGATVTERSELGRVSSGKSANGRYRDQRTSANCHPHLHCRWGYGVLLNLRLEAATLRYHNAGNEVAASSRNVC